MGDVHLYPRAVLKPVADAGEAEWCADLFETLEVAEVRLPRPMRSRAGAAAVMGWCSWERLAGAPSPERWPDTLAVGDRLHRSLTGLVKPGWMDAKADLWRQADRYAWDEAGLAAPHDRHAHPLRRLLTRLEALQDPGRPQSSAQLVHMDLLGNVLFAAGLASAVIDPTFYWRPSGYAAAIVAVDATTWTSAGVTPLEHAVGDDPDLLVRAARFRVASDLLDPDGRASGLDAHVRVVDWLAQHVSGRN